MNDSNAEIKAVGNSANQPYQKKTKMAKKALEAQKTDTFTAALKAHTGLIATKEYKFHETRKWRFDYAILSHKVAIEVDGGRFKKRKYIDPRTGELITTIGGRHNSATGFENDIEKKNNAAILGWKIIVVFPETLFDLATFEMIVRATM